MTVNDTTNETIVAYTQLFQGNPKAVGTEDGGCRRFHDPLYEPEEPWDLVIRDHLTGEGEPVGVYPMVHNENVGEWQVHWGCIDYDEGEERSWVHATNTRMVLERFGITGWIERSRSKGYHVWVFLDDWVPAAVVRTALLAAAQLAGAPTKEINPKQTELAEGQLGNYVRLPYPGALNKPNEGADKRRAMVYYEDPSDDGHESYGLSHFVNRAMLSRSPAEDLERLHPYYKEQKRVIPKITYVPKTQQSRPIHRRMGSLAFHIYTNGPLNDVGDRSTTLYRLACHLVDDGHHSRAEMIQLLDEADARWGKFQGRPDKEQRINETLNAAMEAR